ncbi:T9SS type A sorting domain-containing protein [Flavicella sediminum]|uniref:T9SS type A sorting domain-containing protein n=1 Tax=Flavicella sediminum TaxID=2585141 RepID=UPI00112184E8|nr:T9SS type A sorting domain-containing protein [Flavicella sediminum]
MLAKINSLKNVLSLLYLVAVTGFAQYTETMDLHGLVKNMKADYALVNDNAENDQSSKLISAINAVHDQGGGVIRISKGVYLFSDVYLKSNVHLVIEAGTVIKTDSEKKVVFKLTTENSVQKKDAQAYIENVSIRGEGGAFVVDYHTRLYGDKQRVIVASMVKNFLIQDMVVKDNYSVYCGITLSPSSEKIADVSDWEVSRPTNGTLKNISHYKASPGYGLVQCHGAQNVHFENLYAEGGVTFRLEVGANNKNVGVYDLTAKNMINKNGRCAVMLGPHSAKNGIITVDGATAISSTYAVTVGDGGVKEGAPDQTPGYFHNDSFIDHVLAIYGESAQVKGPTLLYYPSVSDYFEKLKIFSDGKFYEGPSVTALLNGAQNYSITIGTHISYRGFPETMSKTLIDLSDKRAASWGNEKADWKTAHPGDEYISDKGVSTNDYEAVAYDFSTNLSVPIINTTEGIDVYPVPASEYVSLKSENWQEKFLDVFFYNAIGKRVQENKNLKVQNGVLKISVVNLKKGMYVLKVKNNSGVLKVAKPILISK